MSVGHGIYSYRSHSKINLARSIRELRCRGCGPKGESHPPAFTSDFRWAWEEGLARTRHYARLLDFRRPWEEDCEIFDPRISCGLASRQASTWPRRKGPSPKLRRQCFSGQKPTGHEEQGYPDY